MSDTSQKRILLQGATGSIGRSVCEVVREQAERFALVGLSARMSSDALLELCAEYRPESVALVETEDGDGFDADARRLGVRKVYRGDDAARMQAEEAECDLLVNAMAGNAGMLPTLRALERGIDVALANKETMVSAGPIMSAAATRSGAAIVPIDSEHSAIFQCLTGARIEQVRRIWLTTSGGPFWGRSPSELGCVSPAQALDHPRWKMGPKITVDSATLLNKGLEVIEAQRLFGVSAGQIEIIRHPEHVIHSLVEFVDGSFLAQLSVPDMRLPILYALSYPERVDSGLVQTDLREIGRLTFDPVNVDFYPCLRLAYRALHLGGTAPAGLCAADEVAVDAFLREWISFNEISEVISEVLDKWVGEPTDSIERVLEADRLARQLADEAVSARRAGETSCC